MKTGINYNSNLNIKDIAKEVRKFIKENFKGYKFSVTSENGRIWAIRVSLVSAPETVVLKGDNGKFTETGRDVFNKIKGYLDNFNYDNSEATTDYFDVNFFSTISL